MAAPIPHDEPLRLEALRSMQVLDTSQDPRFERLVHLAAQIMNTPIALVSLVDADRQWFKASIGLAVAQTPRDVAFCAHAILSSAPLVVEDATRDHRFAMNPLVRGEPNIRFYAGVPLIASGGYRLGTLCTIDKQPRQASPAQVAALQTLASVVADTLAAQSELKATAELLSASRAEARDRSLFLSSFGHELRTPLSHIVGFSEIIENDSQDLLPRAKCREYASIVRQSANHLFRVIEGIVRLEKAEYGADLSVAPIDVEGTIGEVVRSFGAVVAGKRQRLTWSSSGGAARALVDQTALRQIAVNLISNACKYSPEGAAITVTFSTASSDDRCCLEVADTGPGIADDLLRQLGQPYLQSKDAASRASGGIGLGLRIAKQLARSMHCNLQIMRGPEGGPSRGWQCHWSAPLLIPARSSISPRPEVACSGRSRHRAVPEPLRSEEFVRQAAAQG